MDDGAAAGAKGWLEAGWVLQLFEVVVVGAVVDIHLGLDVLSALGAGLPTALVFLRVVESAQGEPAVIAMAAIPGIGKELVAVLVVADPLPAAVRPHQLGSLPAEEAPLGWIGLGFWGTGRFRFPFGFCGHGGLSRHNSHGVNHIPTQTTITSPHRHGETASLLDQGYGAAAGSFGRRALAASAR